MKTATIVLKKQKETTGTFVYSTTETDVAVRTVYVNKGAFEPMPEAIELTVVAKK